MERPDLNSQDEGLQEFVDNWPGGFVPPAQFIEMMVMEGFPDIDPWMWLPEVKGTMAFWSGILRKQFPYLVLVPFAKDQDSDDVVCFAGNDASGDPAVLLIHTFTTPGWEYRGMWESYAEWNLDAADRHAQWVREETEWMRTEGEGIV